MRILVLYYVVTVRGMAIGTWAREVLTELPCNAVVVNAATKHSAILVFQGDGCGSHHRYYLCVVSPCGVRGGVAYGWSLGGRDKAIRRMKMKGDREDETQNERCHCKTTIVKAYTFLHPPSSLPFPPQGGFSQGGSLAVCSALTYQKQLAGILGLNSSSILLQHVLKKMAMGSY